MIDYPGEYLSTTTYAASNKADNMRSDIDRVHLLNKETLLFLILTSTSEINWLMANIALQRDFVICILNSSWTLLHPVSKTCWDHVYCNQPQRIRLIISQSIGPADHLPIFVVRKYVGLNRKKTAQRIRYGNRNISTCYFLALKVNLYIFFLSL